LCRLEQAIGPDRRGGEPAEAGSIFAQSMRVKHLEHRGSGALHNGDARQRRRAQVKRQDWACRRGEDYLRAFDRAERYSNGGE
jgi:hypothetical protein